MGKAARNVSTSEQDLSLNQTFTKAIRQGKPETWVPTDAIDDDLTELMQLAFNALRAEDEELAGILGARGTIGREYQERGAPGLSYWVFEHNLVYTVFKAWARSYRVLWDERLSARWGGRFDAAPRQRAENDNQQRSLIDLQVVVDKASDERWLFEMQWLNTPTGTRHAEEDANKLRKILKSMQKSRTKKNSRGFLLGIWSHEESRLASDLAWLKNRRPAHTRPAFLGIFPSPKSQPGKCSYHFIALLEVEP